MICRAELRDMSVINEDGVFDGLLDRRRLCLLAQQMETRNGTKFHGKITRVNVYVIDSFFLFIILQPP